MPGDRVTDDPVLVGLDAEQREAVVSMAAPLAIVAAAGSGKTTVLTRRIAYRVAHGTAQARYWL
jgi:DNA helicase-2/ATP-dependent DNA helicase PcrA